MVVIDSIFVDKKVRRDYIIAGCSLVPILFGIPMLLAYIMGESIGDMCCIWETILLEIIAIFVTYFLTRPERVIINDREIIHMLDISDPSTKRVIAFSSVVEVGCEDYDSPRYGRDLNGVYILLENGNKIYFSSMRYYTQSLLQLFDELVKRQKMYGFRVNIAADLKREEEEIRTKDLDFDKKRYRKWKEKRKLWKQLYPYESVRFYDTRIVIGRDKRMMDTYRFAVYGLGSLIATLTSLIILLHYNSPWLMFIYLLMIVVWFILFLSYIAHTYTEEIFIDGRRIVVYGDKKINLVIDMSSISTVGTCKWSFPERPYVYIETKEEGRVYESFSYAVSVEDLKKLFRELVKYKDRYGFEVVDALGWLEE